MSPPPRSSAGKRVACVGVVAAEDAGATTMLVFRGGGQIGHAMLGHCGDHERFSGSVSSCVVHDQRFQLRDISFRQPTAAWNTSSSTTSSSSHAPAR